MAEFEPDDVALANAIRRGESVRGYDLAVAEARSLIDGEVPDDLSTLLDYAQGDVGGGSYSEAYVVIRIRR